MDLQYNGDNFELLRVLRIDNVVVRADDLPHSIMQADDSVIYTRITIRCVIDDDTQKLGTGG